MGPIHDSTQPTSSHGGIRRFLRFSLVGGTGALLNVTLLVLFTELLGFPPLLASLVAIETTTVLNFFLNRSWTWADRRADRWSFVHYHYATLGGILVQWFTVGAFLLGGLHYVLGALAGILLASAFNYLAHHHFTFSHDERTRELRVRIALYCLAGTILLVGSALFAHDWDTFVFERSVADFAVRGNTPYDVAAAAPDYIYFGVGSPVPVKSLWYAYPPLPLILMTATYWPALGGAAPWVGRVLIKLPVVVGTLAFAYLAGRIVATQGVPHAPQLARRVERALLFNPLFLIIAMVWGQFESLVLTFLALSVLALRSTRFGWAGAAWGAATLVKIFPLYLGPLWLVYLVRRHGWNAATKFFGVAGAVFAGVSLPFLLDEPRGFLQQVFLMHGERPPGRFAPIAMVYEALRYWSRRFPGSLPTDLELARALTLLSFLLTSFVLVFLTIASLRGPPTERNLLLWSGISLLGGLATTKLVSEQYMLLPIGLLTVYRFHPGAVDALIPNQRLRRLLAALTYGFIAAAILDSVHFIIFIPEDVALLLFPRPVPEIILGIAGAFQLTPFKFRLLLGAVVGVLLLLPFYYTVRTLSPLLLRGFEGLARGVARPLRVRAPPPHHLRLVLVFILALLVLPSLAVGSVAPRRMVAPNDSGALERTDHAFFVHYRGDWFNPTTRPEFAGGTWSTALYTPVSGYYNSITYKAVEDFELIRLARADAIVIPFDVAYEPQIFGIVLVAEETKTPYALEIDLGSLADPDENVPLTAGTAARARELFDGPSYGFWTGSYHLRLGRDDPRVLFLDGLDRLQPTFEEGELRYVADHLALDEQLRLEAAAPAGLDLWELAPASEAELGADTADAAAWREAYERARQDWWRHAFGFLNPLKPSSRLHLLVASEPDYVFPSTVPVEIVGTYEPVDAAPRSGAGEVRHVAARPNDLEGFQSGWAEAAGVSQALLVSWNDFDLGLGLEPTVGAGADLLAWLVETRGNATLPALRLVPDPLLAQTPSPGSSSFD